MHPIRITDENDPRVAAFRHVREPELIRAEGLFVAESRRVVERLVASARYRVRAVFLSDAASAALGAALPPEATRYVASEALLSRIAGYPVHHGCIALVELPPARAPEDLARGARRGLLVALEEVGNPENIGGVFRNAQAFGADGVLLSPRGADPLYRKAVRVSTGASLVVPFARAAQWPGALEKLRAEGFTLLACVVDDDAIDLREFGSSRPIPARVCLLFGGEDRGLSREVRALADAAISARTAPGFDSLNLATASGVVLHHFSRAGVS